MVMIAGSVSQVFQAGGGIGTDRLVSWPPRNRTCRWMRSVLVMVTSSMSSRAMRLRSRCGVAGWDHRAGKSVASPRDAGLVVLGE